MDDKIAHLSWGLLLSLLYHLLAVMMMCIMRLCSAISPFQTLALMTLSEIAFLLPFAGLIYRQWSIKKTKEWLVFTSLAVSLGCYIAASIFCAQHIGLGIREHVARM